MTQRYAYKSVPESKFGKAVKRYHELLPMWNQVIDDLSDFLGDKITKIVRDPERLVLDVDELSDENAKLFKKDGSLKKNSKKANELADTYKSIIDDAGLSDFKDLHLLKFIYGVMRTSRQQHMESFLSSEGELYVETDWDMLERQKTDGSIEPITKIEYTEKYLSELKKNEEKKA